MHDAVIVSTARTGLAKSWRGALNMTHGATLGGHVVRAAVERAHLDPAEVEDVILGCALPEGTPGGNIARGVALMAGLPVTTGGVTVNRFCSSGLQSIAMAAHGSSSTACRSWSRAGSSRSRASRTRPTGTWPGTRRSSSASPRST
jgi:acetyl-CoA C-acetyltransferase